MKGNTLPLVVGRDLVMYHPRPADENPAVIYLTGLSKGSRKTMLACLNVIARKLVGQDVTAPYLDWSRLRGPHIIAIRSWLLEDYQPATGNKMMTALRRVLYHTWKLGQLQDDQYHALLEQATLRGETIPENLTITAAQCARLVQICCHESSLVGTRDAAIITLIHVASIKRTVIASLDLSAYDPASGMLVFSMSNCHCRMVLKHRDRAILEDWIKVRGREPGPLFCHILRDDKIKTTPLTGMEVYDLLRRRSGQAGVSPETPKEDRKSLIASLLSAGVNAVVAQKVAGYENTGRFSHRADELARKAVSTASIPAGAKL